VTREKHSSGLWQIILTSVITAVVTAALGIWGQDKAAQWADQRQHRTQEVTQFVEAAQKFDVLVTNYMTKLNADQDASKERAALHENIQQQFNLLETAKTNLNDLSNQRATDYQNDLADLGEKLDLSLPAADAQPVAQAIADTRAANVCVVYDLRKKAGLPAVVTDKDRCENTRK
jgi:hypothetical protein